MDIQVDSQNIPEIGLKIRKMLPNIASDSIISTTSDTKLELDESACSSFTNTKLRLQPTIVLISGPLGVGKTTLIKHILPEFQVASPSFLHMLIYGKDDGPKFAHIDAYTLKSKEAFLALGIEELLQTHCIIIEWGELVEEIVQMFDAKVIKIEMRYENEARYIKVIE